MAKEKFLVVGASRFNSQQGDYGSVHVIAVERVDQKNKFGFEVLKMSSANSELNPKLEYLFKSVASPPCLVELNIVYKNTGGKPVPMFSDIELLPENGSEVLKAFFTRLFDFDVKGLTKALIVSPSSASTSASQPKS